MRYQTLLKPLVIGILDLIEYCCFNPTVYHIHNFPDIVPYLSPGIFAAFLSGVICSIVPYGIAFIFESILSRPMRNNMRIMIASFFICLFVMIIFQSYDLFFNHKVFYTVFFLSEVVAFIF